MLNGLLLFLLRWGSRKDRSRKAESPAPDGPGGSGCQAWVVCVWPRCECPANPEEAC